ncbi:hypothetical protein AB0M79_15810 [Polymorphospora sp. NPDC051019]|uniref:hypothetical protein n=1 Tax=Polymorphospora sp. NPDC051019 TaxID=3155725 RepID=UPI003426D48F
MSTSTDPLYIAARRVLLDAFEALAEHRKAVILAGAQAIYVRTGDAELDISIAPFTTDADLTLDPRMLGQEPKIEEAMRSAGFRLTTEPGIWIASTAIGGRTVDVPVDLLVPERLAGRGRRSAELPTHGKNAARRTPGLEAAAADHSNVLITSLEPQVDRRALLVPVAGTAALLVAKAHKLHERLTAVDARRLDRVKPKDASDVIRLMQSDPADHVGARLRTLANDDMAGASVREGVEHLRELFGRRRSPGVDLAVQALTTATPEAFVRTLAPAYMATLLRSYNS